MSESIAVEPTIRSPFRLRERSNVFLQAERVSPQGIEHREEFDLAYRTLCAILYNFVPTSGHPGGSISSGAVAQSLMFGGLDYDFSQPDDAGADVLCYAAGHKAMGLYALWALRDEAVRIGAPDLLARAGRRLRLEDLLGFRRNPTQPTPLFRKFQAKALDGHPTPMTPFVPFATGASGVGMGAALGWAMAAWDTYGPSAPKVHVIEGEGGLTPGRAHEAISAAATMGLENAVVHLDWNQASIDSDRVCAEGAQAGDYVQWDPMELFFLHGWNVVSVHDGFDFRLILGAQRAALSVGNGLPTAVVYRTVKGRRYGIEGRSSHGAGHAFCSEGYRKALEPFEERFAVRFPAGPCDPKSLEAVEALYYETLLTLRKGLEGRRDMVGFLAKETADSAQRLFAKGMKPRAEAPRLDFLAGELSPSAVPAELQLRPGASVSLRAALGDGLGYLNRKTAGAFLGCAADLVDSTSMRALNDQFPKGFWHARRNPSARIVAVGGICEDAMGAFMAGASSYGRHIGVTSSYSGFIAALEHVAARLHGIGQQARKHAVGEPYRTWVMVNAHAGPKTGEDGPTHADPQALQLLQNNFPQGVCITLTPWEPQELWPLLAAGLKAAPAVLCPFVARPPELVPDRAALGLPPASAAAKGVYAVRRSSGKATVVVQGSAVGALFMHKVLPRIDQLRLPVNVFYVTSAELYDLQPDSERSAIFPRELRHYAMGITDFTLPTIARWIRSEGGRRRSLHPFRQGAFLGSGDWQAVLKEGGLDADSQLEAVREWVKLRG